MWNWVTNNWQLITALLALIISLDAERRVYVPVAWKLTKGIGDGYALTNCGFLTERNVTIEFPKNTWDGYVSNYSKAGDIHSNEDFFICINGSEGWNPSFIKVTSRHLFGCKHARTLAL